MATNNPTGEQFIPECQVFYEGDTSQQFHDTCMKNPGHVNFFPVSGLKMENLPLDMQYEEMMKFIQFYSQLTVKITVSYTSLSRPDTWPGTNKPYSYSDLRGSFRAERTGTGYIRPSFIITERAPCPCHKCDKAEQRKYGYWEMRVHTARHVVYDSLEARKTRCQLFYLSDDEKQEITEIYGREYSTEHSGVLDDCCEFRCVTHEANLVDYLQRVDTELKQRENKLKKHTKELRQQLCRDTPFIISHPHGGCQQITFGKIVSETIVTNTLDSDTVRCVFKDKRVTCRLPLFPWSRYNHRGSRSPDDYDVTNDITMTPGTEFSIPLRQVIPPHDAKYICFTDFTKDRVLTTFPAGTQFYTDLHQRLFFPPEVIFLCDRFDISFYKIGNEAYPYNYLTYAIDTCCGSSGAQVCSGLKWFYVYDGTVHCGAIKDGYNRSASHWWRKTTLLEVTHKMNPKIPPWMFTDIERNIDINAGMD